MKANSQKQRCLALQYGILDCTSDGQLVSEASSNKFCNLNKFCQLK